MTALFWLAGVVAVVAALLAVTRENPIYAALWTLVALAGVGVEFALLHSPFLAAMQVLLYAGAIMVLFVFVIMLLSLKKEEHGPEPPAFAKGIAGVVAVTIFFFLVSAAYSFPGHERAPFDESDPALVARSGVEFGSTEHFGQFLYGTSVVPFELVSVLITAAMAAVVVLARKRLPARGPGGAEPVGGGPHVARGPGDADPIGTTPYVSTAPPGEVRP